MPDESPIEIRPQTVCCPAHGEHLRAEFPRGFAVVSIVLFQEAMARDPATERNTLLEACGWQPGENASVERINEVLPTRPLCYFVSRATIRKAFMESGIGKIGRCQICRDRGLGGPYSILEPEGMVQSWLCFSCMLDAGERLHRRHPDGKVWPTL